MPKLRVLIHPIRSNTDEEWRNLMSSRPGLDNAFYQTPSRTKLADAYKRPEESQRLRETELKSKKVTSYLKKSKIGNSQENIRDALFSKNLSKF